MNCWRCGQPLADGTTECVACGASQARTAPTSEAGRAMRQLYDRYGADEVLSNPAYVANGLGDLLEDSSKLRRQLEMALDAGVGREYLAQIRSQGAPDSAFDGRVRTLLTGEAGLSDAVATEIRGLFDEMVGWRGTKPKSSSADKTPNGTIKIDDAVLQDIINTGFNNDADVASSQREVQTPTSPSPSPSPSPAQTQNLALGCFGFMVMLVLTVAGLAGGGFLLWAVLNGYAPSPAFIPFLLIGAILFLALGFICGGTLVTALKGPSDPKS